jgi:hypothetical protein
MKKLFKNFTAMIVAVLMVFSATTTVFATGASTGNIPVDVDITEYVYNVTMPAAVGFSINPYAIATSGTLIEDSQISGIQSVIVNRTTDFAVQVAIELRVAYASGGDLLRPKGHEDLTSAATKSLYLAVVGAATIGGLNVEEDFEFDVDAEGTVFDVSRPTTAGQFGTAEITFALNKFSGSAATEGNVAAFTFYGHVNENVTWAANDVAATVRYTITPLSSNKYGDLVDNFNGLNIVGNSWGFTAKSITVIRGTYIALPFNGELSEIDSIVVYPSSGVATSSNGVTIPLNASNIAVDAYPSLSPPLPFAMYIFTSTAAAVAWKTTWPADAYTVRVTSTAATGSVVSDIVVNWP